LLSGKHRCEDGDGDGRGARKSGLAKSHEQRCEAKEREIQQRKGGHGAKRLTVLKVVQKSLDLEQTVITQIVSPT
jgi:hypothetical protein